MASLLHLLSLSKSPRFPLTSKSGVVEMLLYSITTSMMIYYALQVPCRRYDSDVNRFSRRVYGNILYILIIYWKKENIEVQWTNYNVEFREKGFEVTKIIQVN